MDLIKERKLRKNILHWYNIEKESDILQIGYLPVEIIEELCDKSKNVTILVENEEQKNTILKEINRTNLEIKVQNDFSTFLEKKYDYITLIGTAEMNEYGNRAYKRLENILKFAKNNCKDSGKILLVVDNKYGMKSWTTLSATKNIICNQTYALSQTLVNRLLRENGLDKYKYYYILPDYKVPNVIFTDDYLPNLESINRNFGYGEEEFSNFNQTEAYSELLKENPESFKFFANSFFVEIGRTELEDNGIRFVSYTNIRKEKYKIQTIIYKDRVEKTCLNEKNREHIENIMKNIDFMNQKNIDTLDKYENGKIISKYIENSKSYDKILLELLEQDKEEEFFAKIENYKKYLLDKLEEVEYSEIENDNILKKYDIKYTEAQIEKLHFVKYGLWDLIFQNAFYIDDKLYFYDQEWFDYNIPIEFIIYRTIAYFPNAHSFIKSEELYKRLGLEKYIDLFQELDLKIQEEIRDEEIWNIHNRTKTGQTLMDLYYNLKNEFENYKLNYNQTIVDKNEEIKENNIELKEEIQKLHEQIEKIYDSNSWKITKPIRWLGKNIKGKKLGGRK